MSTVEFVTKSEYDELLKNVKKMQKQLRKVMKHFKEIDVDEAKPKKLSGFAKPTSVSAELANFLGLHENELIARTEVTKRINTYVKEHNLQNSENKREIVLDETLKALINPPDDIQLTFFNLQKYIKHHYTEFQPAKEETAAAVEEEVAEVSKPKKVMKKKVKK